jgi:GDP/UDP-N,N'-diacetylbacillosamine 2-epimerase (hydrolysing)
MEGICQSPQLTLQLIVTGMHLSPEFGLTLRDIEADGFCADRKVEMLLSSDTSVGLGKSMGVGMIGFADALADLKPDLVLVLGDRYEIFAAASAAMVTRIPLAHLHGGEVTQGAFDESIRHCITKMSHLHFVATEEYRRRVIQLGEQPENVFLVGGLGVDSIRRMKLLDRAELESLLGFKLGKRNLLVTFHPVTLGEKSSEQQMEELLASLGELEDTHLIFTLPNADTEGRTLVAQIARFCDKHPLARSFSSLGQLRYLSCAALVDGVVGNSSSGLLEVPSLNNGTVNIGDRQSGRLQAASVINCEPDRDSIRLALNRLYSPAFRALLPSVENPYGAGGASEMIVSHLEHFSFERLVRKPFYDLPLN